MSALIPSTSPTLTRAFACPSCTQALVLEYRPAADGVPISTLFDCPGCGESCLLDLPGPLRKIRQRV
jgi:hypothetical protein